MPFLCFYFQNFLNSSSCPEIQGYLHLKEPGRKSWKKLYMFLRRSGLYYSTKGTSKVLIYCSREQDGCVHNTPLLLLLTSLALFMVDCAVFRENSTSCHPTGAPTPSAAVRPGGQQHLHRHHRKEASQRSHRLPVLHQGNVRRLHPRVCVCVCHKGRRG